MTTENTNANPSIDPANEDTLLGVLKVAIGKAIQEMDNVLPATIVAYDRVTNRAQVQPQIRIINTNGQSISRAQIASVPVYQYGGGGFLLNFPLKPGALGWIVACDRYISQFLQSYSQASPNTYRKKNFSDSFFLPDIMTGYTISSDDSDNAVLQNLDGTVKISLGIDSIKIVAPTITLNSENLVINATSSVSITTPSLAIDASSTASITSPAITVNSSGEIITTTPKFAVAGDITASGSITPGTPP